MCTFQVNILLCKSASTHLTYNFVLNHYLEPLNEVLYQILSQGISELQEVRDESYKNAYVFYWSNFESQKVFLILLEIKLYAIPHLKALTSDWHIYGRTTTLTKLLTNWLRTWICRVLLFVKLYISCDGSK